VTTKENSDVRRFCRHLALLVLPLLCLSAAYAQAGIDVNVGFGTNHAKSSGQSIDTFGDGTLYRTPSMGGFFLGLGGNLMLWKHLGVGAEVQLQPNKPDYAGLQARTTFWDINGIYQPVSAKRASLQLIGGIGGANMRFYYSSQYCSQFSGCSSQNQFLESSNHFQVHGGVGVQLYLTDHVFIRPQFDIRYVHNFFQFGSNAVPGASVWLGYSLGDRP
jgi:opacity protein-like surface antigen